MDSNKEKMHVHTWKIENFSMCCKKRGDLLISPIFKANSFDKTAWRVKFYPRGDSQSCDGYSSCYLMRRADVAVPFDIEFEVNIEIINKYDQTLAFRKFTNKFKKGGAWGYANFMKTDKLEKTALFDDTLIIRCTLCGDLPGNNFNSQNTSSTKFKISKHSFQWVIKNLNDTRQEVIKLPCSGAAEAEITIQSPEDDIKIVILMNGNFSGPRFILCHFSLLDVEGKERDSKQATHLFETTGKWEFPTFIKKSQVNHKDGCFTLQCDIAVSDGSAVEDIEEKEDLPLSDKFTDLDKDSIAVLIKDIKRMYADKIHTDIKLKVGTQAFSAHKSVLCARSPVFYAMFHNDMTESQNGEVVISDFDAETVDLLLEYLYTGTVSKLDYEKATKLIAASDKYQVLPLKNKCAEWLMSILSDLNVCEILVVADLIQHHTLKTSTLDYIKSQPDKIFNSEKWQQFVKNNFELATNTFCEVSRFWGNQTKEQSGK